METTFIAPDIECGGCAASIEKALGRAPGVEAVTVDIASKRVTVRYHDGQTSREALADTLSEVGFPPDTA